MMAVTASTGKSRESTDGRLESTAESLVLIAGVFRCRLNFPASMLPQRTPSPIVRHHTNAGAICI